MSTRSYIAKLNSDGSVVGIYCHHDGYPDGVGKTLQKHYSDEETVASLIQLGSLSSLGEDLDVTQAYHRDRGEDLDEPVVYPSVEDMVRNVTSDLGAEYAYVYDAVGGWQTFEF